MNITTIGIDLAKTSFSLVGSDKHGKIVLRKTVNRGKLLSVIAQCPPCMVGLEACSGAHYWAREFEKLGHQVRIIAVKFIEPYRKGGKNDNNDAEAICEAVRRPNIWFVPVKSADQPHLTIGEVHMNITTIGIDLAKTSFSLVGSDKHGKIVLRKTVNRGKLLSVIAQCPPCMVGLEACSGAHYWAREFEKLGHQVRIIAVKFIEPYRKGGKNDNNDAEAICEAVRRPNIWFVPVKSADQQAELCVHRVRQGVVR